jgi:DNA-binding response OmpR family regulator
MNNTTIKVLLVEMNSGVYSINRMLNKSENVKFEVTNTSTFNNGLKILKKKKFDIILLDLDVSYHDSLNSFKEILKRYISMPIIVLTSLTDEKIGIKIIKYGVQDYLVKGEFNGKLLVRAVQYAIERKKMEGIFNY